MAMYGGRRGIGGGSGGGMLRTVVRTVARVGLSGNSTSSTTLQEPPLSSASNKATAASSTSASRPNRPKKLLAASNDSNNFSVPAAATSSFSTLPANANYEMARSWPAFDSSPSSCGDEFEWVQVDETGDERGLVSMDDYLLGPVPSTDEVQNTVSALQQVIDPFSSIQLGKDNYSYSVGNDIGELILSPGRQMVRQDSSSGSEQDWREPSFHFCTHQSYGLERVYDAFHLLRTEPAVQRMVVSLSSDQAVWDAVLNNEVVRELRTSYLSAEGDDSSSQGSNTSCEDEATNVVQWIFTSAQAKFMEVLEKLTNVLSRLFKLPSEDQGTAILEPFDGKIRTSLALSVLVLLIVVVTRARGA